MQQLKFLGVPVYMNGQNYYIPSLSKRQYQENYSRLSAGIPEDTPKEEVVNYFDDLILLAINRNYPEVTAENLRDWLDLNSSKLAVEAVTASTKLTAVSGGE